MTAALFALAGCAALQPPPPEEAFDAGATREQIEAARDPRPDPMALVYRWPAGVAFDVTSTLHRYQGGPDAVPDTLRFTWRLRTEADGDLLRVHQEDFAFEAAAEDLPVFGPGGAEPAAPQEAGADDDTALELLRRLIPVQPVLVIGEDGQVASVEGAAAAVDAFWTALAEEFADEPEEESAALRERLAGLLTEQRVEFRAMRTWNDLVGAWAGASLRPGVEYEWASAVVLPAISLSPMRIEGKAVLTPSIPCEEGDAEGGCVRVNARGEVDPDLLASALDDLLQAPTLDEEAAPAEGFRRAQLEQRVQLVTEPGSLLPRSLETHRLVTLVVAGPDGGDREHLEYLEVQHRLVLDPATLPAAPETAPAGEEPAPAEEAPHAAGEEGAAAPETAPAGEEPAPAEEAPHAAGEEGAAAPEQAGGEATDAP